MESTNGQQKQREYEIVLPNELIRLVAFAMPEEDVRQEKNISKTLDNYIGERKKAALAAETVDRMKANESGQLDLDQVKFDLLLEASRDGYIWRVRQLLMKGGVREDWLRENKGNILHEVINQENASVAVVKLLLDHGVPVDGRCTVYYGGGAGDTPLHNATLYNKLAVCELLLSNGANPNAEGNAGFRPLYWAAYFGSIDILRLLLKNGAKLDAVMNLGKTCLHATIYQNRMDVAKIILNYAEENGGLEAKKALLDVRDENGQTALHLAYYHYKLDMAKWLKEQGASK